MDAAATNQPAVGVRLTQEELSQMTGASRNTVGAAIKPWREEGWLKTDPGGGLLIHDITSIVAHARSTM
ncbi:helix-turn-helix domain-containing protein [Streptomyces sp. NPDC086080]|uniref:helix-turn-helix domain-containing protein n=1 Tax=Streptomyces sp. NPDC086080 TaxID=3365748 RepID=UPI0037D207E1